MKNTLAFGTFDGVHIGHRRVLELPDGCRKIAVVFRQSPKSVMNGVYDAIMTYEDKCRIIKKIGIDEIFALDFDKVRNIQAADFLENICDKFSPVLISCGFNYRFGKNAEGDTALLGEFCRRKGIEFRCCEPVRSDGETVSSTVIRGYLKNGEIKKADALLTEAFSFSAEVISGDRRGRTLGFPTVNQKYPEELVKVKFGVYRSEVIFGGRTYSGITNIGIRPTYRSDYIISETYIHGFSGDLYGKTVTVRPLEYLRREMKFSSPDALKRQIQEDIESLK